MSKMFMMAILVIALGSVANGPESPKTSTKKEMIIKADTAIKIDTTKKITFDTSYIIKTYKDTSILVKTDTTKLKHKVVK